MKSKIKAIGFDADDTLWVNEPFFRETENEFCELFKNDLSKDEVMKVLFKTEIDNLSKYGYGSRALMLSMIETTMQLYEGQITSTQVKKIMDFGSHLLARPRYLIDGVQQTLEALQGKYKLILITKGDLLEQEQKVEKSGLSKYFDYIEIFSEKHPRNYNVLLQQLNVKNSEFLMVGNSLKSDIQPVLKLGCYGAYIPFEITWQHERMDVADVANDKFVQLNNILELVNIL